MGIQTDQVPLHNNPDIPINDPGGVLQWSKSDPVIVIGLVIDIASAVAAHVSFGAAANITTPSANLIDTLPVNAVGAFDRTNGGANGKSCQKTRCVTGTTVANEDAAGLQGYAYITYLT